MDDKFKDRFTTDDGEMDLDGNEEGDVEQTEDRFTTDEGNSDIDGNGEDDIKQATDLIDSSYEKGKEYIREFNEDIENVIDFLEKHPALAGMITGGLPGTGIAVWAYENPEQARSFAFGGVLGEMGMPDGVLEVTQSESSYYLLGMLGIASTPYVGVLADSRDFYQNSYSAVTEQSLGDAGEATLDAVGLVGSLGGFGVGDAPKVASVTGQWVSRFGSSPVVIKTMATFLSNSASRQQIRVALDIVSDKSASELLHRGESMDDVIQYAMKGDLKENAKLLANRPPSTGKITNDQYLELSNKYSEQLVDSMTRRGVSGDKMEDLIDSGVDLEKAKPLVKEGYSGDEILELSNKGISPEMVTPLAKEGATTDDILMLNRKDADIDLATDLATDEMPMEHIKYYAKEGNDLDGVKWFTENGIRSKDIKKLYTARNKNKIGVDEAVTGSEYYTIANNYCNWQSQPGVDEKWKAQDFCQTIQVSSLDGTNSTKATN